MTQVMSKDIVPGMPPKVKEFAAGFGSPGLRRAVGLAAIRGCAARAGPRDRVRVLPRESDSIVLTDTLEEGLRTKKMPIAIGDGIVQYRTSPAFPTR